MLIAFEGVDGSGKSGLATAVADKIQSQREHGPVRRIHCGPLDRDPLAEYAHVVADYVPTSGQHVIFDRIHWGETIFGPLYREESALSLAQFRWVELFLAARGADVWHVTQPLDVLQRRLEARGEDFLQSHHVDLVRRRFAEVSDSALTCAGTVAPEGDTSEIVDQILDHARYSEQQAGTLVHRYSSFVGRPVPHTLLVGDKRGGKPPYATTSAFMPVHGNSGDFLLSSLDEQWWRGVAMVNGVEEGDRLVQLYDELCAPQVLALGRKASDVLLDLGIDHGGVPHPAYVRRYHFKKKDEYGRLVRDYARSSEMSFSWPKS